VQADRFSDAVRGVGDVPVPLEDAIANMAVIDAIFRSTESGRWESLVSRA
jgi:predicted dehydrogenase